MKTKTMLHILRNPFGHSDNRKKQARLKAADEIDKLEGRMQLMWAWHDFKGKRYKFIYEAKMLVEMCSPDGFKLETKRGEGRIIQVKVQEIKSNISKLSV